MDQEDLKMTKSPSLEVISDNSQKAQDNREKRKKPRIHLSSEQFRIDQTGKLFSVVDLSVGGMAFRILDLSDLAILPVATELSGILNLRGAKFPVRVQVKNIRSRVVGCQFIDLATSTRAALEKFLDPAELGRELKPIPTAQGAHGSGEGATLWYHGPGGTDLLFSRALDGRYHRFTLFVLGSYIQWDEEGGATTGRAVSSDDRRDQRGEEWGAVQFETIVLDADSQPARDKLSIAKDLILSSNLPQDLKKWCVRQLALPQ
jgi:hypothetical protein